MTSVSAGHIILTPTQPVGSRRPQQESNPGPPHQESHALPTELTRPPYIKLPTLGMVRLKIKSSLSPDLRITKVLQCRDNAEACAHISAQTIYNVLEYQLCIAIIGLMDALFFYISATDDVTVECLLLLSQGL